MTMSIFIWLLNTNTVTAITTGVMPINTPKKGFQVTLIIHICIGTKPPDICIRISRIFTTGMGTNCRQVVRYDISLSLNLRASAQS